MSKEEYKIKIDVGSDEVPPYIRNEQHGKLIAVMLDMGVLDFDDDILPILKRGTVKMTKKTGKELFIPKKERKESVIL